MKRVTWRELITEKMKELGDDWQSMVEVRWGEPHLGPFDGDELDRPFDAGYGGAEGTPFFLWTDSHVYFAATYDGSEWVEAIPLDHYSTMKPMHVGGG